MMQGAEVLCSIIKQLKVITTTRSLNHLIGQQHLSEIVQKKDVALLLFYSIMRQHVSDWMNAVPNDAIASALLSRNPSRTCRNDHSNSSKPYP